MNHNGINILTGNGDVPQREYTSSPGMHILTGNAHSLYRVTQASESLEFDSLTAWPLGLVICNAETRQIVVK